MRTGKIKPGYNYFSTQMVFDIKMGGNSTIKSCLFADDHKIDAPASIKYLSVVSRDSVRVAFCITSLNGLNICFVVFRATTLMQSVGRSYGW